MKRRQDVKLVVHDGRKMTNKEVRYLCKWLREQARYIKQNRNLFADKFTATVEVIGVA